MICGLFRPDLFTLILTRLFILIILNILSKNKDKGSRLHWLEFLEARCFSPQAVYQDRPKAFKENQRLELLNRVYH